MKRVVIASEMLHFICPECHNRTVYNAERDMRSLSDVHYGDIFICDECGAEFEGSLGRSGLDLSLISEEEW